MPPTVDDFDLVFGPESSGETEEARALSSNKMFVRSQVQLAEDNDRATGQRLTAREALWLYGWDVLSKVARDGFAPLVTLSDEPAATLTARRLALNLTQQEVARAASLSIKAVEKAETPGTVSPIRDLIKIAQKLALNEYLLGFLKGAGGDKTLGVRLREMQRLSDVQRFSPSDVLSLSEAAWIIATQSELLDVLGNERQKNLRSRFEVNSDYRFPTYERGYELALKTRQMIGISSDEPIRSIKQVLERKLGIPVIQDRLSERFAGATVANGRSRGIVVNELGQNSNVWVRRMTVAHELGHLLWDPDNRLNKLRVDRYDNIEANPKATRAKDPVEIRTNAFAITFLAPPSAMEALAKSIPDNQAFLAKVMMEYGISATAARYHIRNTTGRDVSGVPPQDLPSASTEWTAVENLTVDWFPLQETSISRRGNFAVLVAKAYEAGYISADTAATYLQTTKDRFELRCKDILSAGA